MSSLTEEIETVAISQPDIPRLQVEAVNHDRCRRASSGPAQITTKRLPTPRTAPFSPGSQFFISCGVHHIHHSLDGYGAL
jgi:hypothetical protein